VLLLWGIFVIRLPKPVLQTYHKDAGTGPRKHLQAGLFDVTGTGLLVLALISLVLALNLAGNDLRWSHPLIPILFVASALLFATFTWVELKIAKVPLVPVEVFLTNEILSIMGTVLFSSAFITAVSVLTAIRVR
jgi:hypothetical protein